MTMTDNPREAIGGNQPPDYAQEVIDRLAREYPHVDRETAALLDEARTLPNPMTDESLPDYTRIVKAGRDLFTRLDTMHDAEKQPYLRGGQGCDGFFFTFMDKIKRRTGTRGAKPGMLDILQARIDNFAEAKRVAEEQRRRQEAIEAERKRLAAEAARIQAEQEAEAARLAAERARKPHTQEAKEEVAAHAETQATAARIEEFQAANTAEIATIQAAAKPADMIRTRMEEGILTSAKRDDATVTDYDAIDLNKLRPFINRDALDKAVRQWARNTNYAEPMAGVQITRRTGGRII